MVGEYAPSLQLGPQVVIVSQGGFSVFGSNRLYLKPGSLARFELLIEL